ncbi:serine phosphatase RsbU (regulator of sigma subunit) [Allocatelliglobosispora scoriae]|uniref:Serine phosphatase RsbU (Regulator of sigma subunit) n=1 Tax=Allocatelliglobosispora scoriae TaxID=643052 RepID=A0A841BPU4_9ACTN|nr:PP2C family protein-serine/threonine phosphatase [Allocatelliglobosispora scoriae]MBB5868840.1 serine phosphatase RsbU (regulator of sigma subunit) [Allocatelliglobosispora scoriae]
MASPFDDAGSLREAYEAVDWAATPLGPVESWSPALLSAVGLTLNTRFAATLLWGPEFILVYNEAYVPLIAGKHPAALGAPAELVFPEIWATIDPMLRSVRAGEGATWVQDLRLDLDRRGFLEECYFTFSYSAVTGADGRIEGVIDIAAETTAQLQARRRLELLSRLTYLLADLDDVSELLDRALPLLRADEADLPGVAIELPEQLPPRLADTDLFLDDTGGTTVAHLRLTAVPSAPQHAVLVTGLSPHLPHDEEYLRFLRLTAAVLAQALDRVHARQSERRVAAMQRQMSEALQRSLLTLPVRAEHLEIAVRYQPAAEQVFVGGDWYDSFALADDRVVVVIGDVTGHDQRAAAEMAQLRNLLRGIAFTSRESPALVLGAVDAAMNGLEIGALATAVLAEFVPGTPTGGHTMRWSNAGHLPPILLAPDGTCTVLDTVPEALLGLAADTVRSDHSVRIEPGSTVVLYTDGLVERRGDLLTASVRKLAGSLAGRQGLSPERLCDELLRETGTDVESDDDIVLTVVRTAGR